MVQLTLPGHINYFWIFPSSLFDFHLYSLDVIVPALGVTVNVSTTTGVEGVELEELLPEVSAVWHTLAHKIYENAHHIL